MVTLLKLLEQLSLAELSNINLSDSGSGIILEEHIPKVVLHINEGLLRMHTRIPLSQKDVLIEQQDHITNYHLLSQYAQSNVATTLEPYPYILDLHKEPFGNDVIKILKVYDSTGLKLPLNDSEKDNSVFTPQNNVLQVPSPVTGICLSVLYQANHPTLLPTDLSKKIELPASMLECLRVYVAYKIFSAIGTQESQAKSQEHYAYFNSLIDEVVITDSANTSMSTTNSKFFERGWV